MTQGNHIWSALHKALTLCSDVDTPSDVCAAMREDQAHRGTSIIHAHQEAFSCCMWGFPSDVVFKCNLCHKGLLLWQLQRDVNVVAAAV
jgi:hypothetical protein